MHPIFRFAPSPTGLLHLGHAASALAVWRAAAEAGGRVLLRIEDTDRTRCRPEFADAIFEDLEWLGFAWEGPVRRQSDHFEDYAAALQTLKRQNLVYPCGLSRADLATAAARLAAEGRPPHHDPEGAPRLPLDGAVASAFDGAPAWRLHMARAADGPALGWREDGEGPAGERGFVNAWPEAWGDVVVARKDTLTSYHLAVVVDDALQGITHVVRGQDLFYATAIHRLLQSRLDLPEPIYSHHRLLCSADGHKLSKSRGSKSLRALREAGWRPEDVFAALDA